MYSQVEQKLLVNYDTPAYSQAVSMAGANGVMIEATCFNYTVTGGTNPKLRITVEHGNDLQNWENLSGTTASKLIDFTAMGYGTAQIDSIASQYVRLKLEYETDSAAISAGKAVIAAGINTGNL
jgi:hypothetical protein